MLWGTRPWLAKPGVLAAQPPCSAPAAFREPRGQPLPAAAQMCFFGWCRGSFSVWVSSHDVWALMF